MHPEMQLKVLKIVRSMFKQVVIATHSIEIISNVSPRNIIAIDKKSRQMKYANEISEV
jgi:predicted ATPase